MAIIGEDDVIYFKKPAKCGFHPRQIMTAVPGITSPEMQVDDHVLYTSEGCFMELQLEKFYRKVSVL